MAKRTLPRRRIPSPYGGTDYRIGDWAVIKEDVPSQGEWDEAPTDVTWGILPWADYERLGGGVGLPDCKQEFGTLGKAHDHIESLLADIAAREEA